MSTWRWRIDSLFICKTIEELERFINPLKQNNKRIGFVPTMGALHDGHMSLVNLCRPKCDVVAVSIFVNPLQFGENEDLEKYPRTLEGDIDKLASSGVDVLFLPTVEEMYPKTTHVSVEPVDANKLCGISRPGHFSGVLTVVSKLFNIVKPDVAVFGKKDYQQLTLIRGLNESLNFGIEIIGAPIKREESGLALSSRNKYLTSGQRVDACAIYAGLHKAKKMFRSNERSVEKLRNIFLSEINHIGAELDYAELCDVDTLNSYDDKLPEKAVFIVAVKFAGVRLIDNMELHIDE